MTKIKKALVEQEEAIARLREWCPPGTKVYTILRHVSSSGMTRFVDFKIFEEDKSASHIGYNVALALGYKWDDSRNGVKLEGCGVDVGFNAVHHLSYKLHGHDSLNIEEHERGRPITPTPEKYKAGYSLQHEWL